MAGPVVVAERGDVGDGRLGVGGAQRLRHGLRHLRRAQGDERRVVGEAAPLQPAEEAAQGREGAGGGAALQAGAGARGEPGAEIGRSEEHTSELQSLMRISYAGFCLKKKIKKQSLNK